MNFNEVPYRYPARSVVVDGFRVAYVDVNPDAADAVVFLHDVGGDLDDFVPVYERIAGDRLPLRSFGPNRVLSSGRRERCGSFPRGTDHPRRKHCCCRWRIPLVNLLPSVA